MATLRNRRKLAAVFRKTPESTVNSQSQKTPNAGIAEEYITQVSDETKERVTKKFSHDFCRTESTILDALSELDGFFSGPTSSDLFRSCSGNIQEQKLTKLRSRFKLFPR